jgi:hypothetical protein
MPTVSIPRPSKLYQNLYFGYENISSGNPATFPKMSTLSPVRPEMFG